MGLEMWTLCDGIILGKRMYIHTTKVELKLLWGGLSYWNEVLEYFIVSILSILCHEAQPQLGLINIYVGRDPYNYILVCMYNTYTISHSEQMTSTYFQ